MSYYIVGDIHGELFKLADLMNKIKHDMNSKKDSIIFLGDYVDRGPYSYEVIEYLLALKKKDGIKTIFLPGNHEYLLLAYYNKIISLYEYKMNGGNETIVSYERHLRPFNIPSAHFEILNPPLNYFETDDFIAVHAGINPEIKSPEKCSVDELVWIRAPFFRPLIRWKKTVIFGHSPTHLFFNCPIGEVWDNTGERNIIGIDTAAVFNGRLSAVKMPEKLIFQSGK